MPRLEPKTTKLDTAYSEPATDQDALDQVPAPNLLLADQQLAQRCAAGEVTAWEELYSGYHDRLVSSARAMLNGRTCDPTLAEELVARVWYMLVAKDGELLTRFDPTRGARLVTFLRVIMRDVIGRHFRSERRRAAREGLASNGRPAHHSAELDQMDTSLDEFLESLTPAEREFCGEHLLNQALDDEMDGREISRANIWQRTHRVYRRFLRFFEE